MNKRCEREIKEALEMIGFELDEKMLNKQIEQNGENISVGKSKICIARTLLRKTKVIIMNEATASIDMKTEEKIQKAINEIMKNSTLITIAHRIKRIINYDKILVLNEGKLMEFDSRENLLKNENSVLYQFNSKSVV